MFPTNSFRSKKGIRCLMFPACVVWHFALVRSTKQRKGLLGVFSMPHMKYWIAKPTIDKNKATQIPFLFFAFCAIAKSKYVSFKSRCLHFNVCHIRRSKKRKISRKHKTHFSIKLMNHLDLMVPRKREWKN